MTEGVNRDLGRLEGRLDEFIKAREARDTLTDERFDRLESKVQALLDAANMGKGAWWLALKVGGLMTVIATAFAWVVQKVGF